MWNRSEMPTPSSFTCRPERRDEAHGVARARVLRLDRLQRGDDQQALVVRAAEVAVGERVAVARERSACSPLRCVGPGREVRAGEVVVHRGGDVDVDAADLVDHLLEVREVRADHAADRHADDRRHRVGLGAEVVAAPVFTMYELSFAPPGPSVSRGMSMIVAAPQRRVHADHVDGVGEAGVVGRLAPGRRSGRRCRARARRTAGRARRCRARRPSFVTWIHTAAAAGAGLPSASHAAADARRRASRPHSTGVTHEQRAACDGGGGSLRRLRSSPAGVVVVVGDEAGRRSRVTAMLYAVIFHPPEPSGCEHEVGPLRTMCSGSPLTAVCAVDVEDCIAAVTSTRLPPWSPRPTQRHRRRRDVEVAGDLGEALVEHRRRDRRRSRGRAWRRRTARRGRRRAAPDRSGCTVGVVHVGGRAGRAPAGPARARTSPAGRRCRRRRRRACSVDVGARSRRASSSASSPSASSIAAAEHSAPIAERGRPRAAPIASAAASARATAARGVDDRARTRRPWRRQDRRAAPRSGRQSRAAS